MSKITRRGFLGTAGAAGVGLGMAASYAAAQGANRPEIKGKTPPGRATANEKIQLGFVGVAGRGNYLLDRFLTYDDVNVAAICDVYDEHVDAAIAKTGGKAQGYKDYRKLLERNDIDAIVCATPPHWHPLVTIDACEAGKDVYCEKPMCMTPAEGLAMVEAARKNNRVTQIGTQIHATTNYHHVVDVVRSGILGDISAVHCVLTLNESAPNDLGNAANENPPEGLDWDMWCGPKPLIPYNPVIFTEGRHRYLQVLIGSWLHEMGPHIVDLPVWALDLKAPKRVTAMQGRYALQDLGTIPDTVGVCWDYGDLMMTWTNQCANSHGLQFQGEGEHITRRLGISFHGTKGSLLADYNTIEVVSEGERLNKEDLPPAPEMTWPEHDREFLDCIKSRELPSCDVGYHINVHLALNLGNLAAANQRQLNWDAEKNQIAGDAKDLTFPDYRDPWVLPA